MTGLGWPVTGKDKPSYRGPKPPVATQRDFGSKFSGQVIEWTESTEVISIRAAKKAARNVRGKRFGRSIVLTCWNPEV